ncbi:MAG: hypothetical protein V3U26_01805, partial [Dehalococcoidia bacterium]
MGHERIGILPRTKPWANVVAQIVQIPSSDRDVAKLANATLTNVRARFRRIHKDEGVKAAFQFLVSLSISGSLGTKNQTPTAPPIDLASNPSPLQLATDLHGWVNAHRQSFEYADIARKAATDVIAIWSEHQKLQPDFSGEYGKATEIWRKA